jgi:hypothetical protein
MKPASLIALTALALCACNAARAQFSNPMGSMSMPSLPTAPSAPSIPSASSLPSIPSLSSMPSLSSVSPSNLAGVLKYCVENHYLSGSDAGAAQTDQSSLLSQDNISPSDPNYDSGSEGELNTGGQGYNLGGQSAQSGVTQQICNQALSHAQSLL